jgi:hypothetical protein
VGFFDYHTSVFELFQSSAERSWVDPPDELLYLAKANGIFIDEIPQ